MMLSRLLRLLLGLVPLVLLGQEPPPRPNILWLTSEDHGPHMGCYGDAYATTPHVDALAARGLTWRRAWSGAPVCAPARTTLITGLYAPSTGGEPMRSEVPAAADRPFLPQLLREAGYHCSNNSKEDYNLVPRGRVWDESSRTAHWRSRRNGQPFFSVFNSTRSHESQLRVRPHTAVHDPDRVRVPEYHPDTPEVRQDWAQYHDTVTLADAEAGRRLAELEADGLVEDTIVFYFSDHGSGMPRNKRWPYNAGLQVALVVYIPEKFAHLRPADYRPGGMTDRMVAFVDFAPTVLSLAGIRPPDWMHGGAFLGGHAVPATRHLHGFRSRMDERPDLVRSVTDGRHVYIRNYHPHRIQGQHVAYMFQTPTTRVWQEWHASGRATPAQAAFWQPKAPEELYDLATDPDEVRNLAGSPGHAGILARLREANREHILRIRDLGFLPEGELHRRRGGMSPTEFGRDDVRFPLGRILAMAERASMPGAGDERVLRDGLSDTEPAVRYWAAMGLGIRGTAAAGSREALVRALEDASPDVRVAAAEALARAGRPDDLDRALPVLLRWASPAAGDVHTAMAALVALDDLGDRAAGVAAGIRALSADGPPPPSRYREYVPRLLETLQGRFAE